MYICLEEWVTGTQVHKSMQVIDVKGKYEDILKCLLEAKKHKYGSPRLQVMYHEWWDYGRCVSSCIPIFIFYFNILNMLGSSMILESKRNQVFLEKNMGPLKA